MLKQIAVLITLLFILPATAALGSGPDDILNRYVKDFRRDVASEGLELSFGVKIKGLGIWTVQLGGEGEAFLKKGEPPEPSFLYLTDMETLRKMDREELGVITAMGRASASDPAPMDFEMMPGYSPPGDFMDFFTPFTFHFWTRGFPEMIKFGDKKNTRVVHGANVTAFYYQKGFRSAWYQIEKGQHINQRPEDQTNPFPTLLVFTSGEAEARIGDRYMKIKEGTSVMIPAGVAHEFWNNRDEDAEFIILMFGEGA
ncbi:MAG: cupin domain-containing protein [Candidatus Krumholzibacteriota bacterium]|nr:cupin domain-containing protein [Candidatus Krumholzibacteriota bacterium]